MFSYFAFPMYLSILTKLVVGGASILIYLNISGRTQLSQMNAVDLIANFILGAIVGGVLFDQHATIHKFIIVLLMAESLLLLLHWGMHKSDGLRRFIIGKPIPIIRNGRFLMDDIGKNKSRVDLLNVASQLNKKGILSFDEIYYAQIEPNGEVTAICDKNRLPAKMIIYQGIFRQEALTEIKMTEEEVEAEIKSYGIEDISNVFLCEYKNDRFQCITKEGSVYPPHDWRQAQINKKNEAEKKKAEEQKEEQPTAAQKIVDKIIGDKTSKQDN